MHDCHHHLFLWDVLAAQMHSASFLLDTDYSFGVVVVFLLHTSLVCIVLSCFFFVFFLVVIPSDCVRSSGVGYRGVQQSSSSGLSCLNWTNTTRDYDLGTYPDLQTGKGTSLKKKKKSIVPLRHRVVCFLSWKTMFGAVSLLTALQDMQQLPCNPINKHLTCS